MKNIYEEGEGPTNNVGSGNIASVGVSNVSKPAGWGEPGISKSAQRKHRGNILRRSPPQTLKEGPRTGMFAGSQTFIVPSEVFHEARHQKRKGAHWSKYIGEEDHWSYIREYARKNPKKAIVLQDENTGAMCYAKYGKQK